MLTYKYAYIQAYLFTLQAMLASYFQLLLTICTDVPKPHLTVVLGYNWPRLDSRHNSRSPPQQAELQNLHT